MKNFKDHLSHEIKNKPYENLNSLVLNDNEYYFSHKGSNNKGTYEWESLNDASFKVVTIDDLISDSNFIEKLHISCKEFQIDVNNKNIQVLILELMDESLGFNLPFTLMNINEFNKELLYFKSK